MMYWTMYGNGTNKFSPNSEVLQHNLHSLTSTRWFHCLFPGLDLTPIVLPLHLIHRQVPPQHEAGFELKAHFHKIYRKPSGISLEIARDAESFYHVWQPWSLLAYLPSCPPPKSPQSASTPHHLFLFHLPPPSLFPLFILLIASLVYSQIVSLLFYFLPFHWIETFWCVWGCNGLLEGNHTVKELLLRWRWVEVSCLLILLKVK